MGEVEWRLRRRWLLVTGALCLAWAAAWVGGFAAAGALESLPPFAYAILSPFIVLLTTVYGRRLRLTDQGLEYVGGLSRLSVAWTDVKALDRRHLTYGLARETTNDTGLKISMDSFVRATPRKHRRIPLRPFLDGEGYRVLTARLSEHRPDLVPVPPP